MAKKGKGFFNEALLKQKRTRRRVELVGSDGVNIQDERKRKAGKNPKAQSRATMQRMKEYRQGHADKVINKVKVYKHPGNK